MKNIVFYIAFLTNILFVSAQIFDVDTLKFSGDSDKRINLVVLSEGYQTTEFNKFITDATSLKNKMFTYSPFSEYNNYFNVFAVKVPSNESGADHPGMSSDPPESPASPIIPIKTVDTYFNATYDSFDVHRLLFYEIDGAYANNTEIKIANVLANNFPNYDCAIILVNSNEYGGSGGKYPMAYSGFYSTDVVVHEMGHSLFNLIDEYYPIDDALAVEGINMTQETDPNLVRWKNWLSFSGVGIYQHFDNGGNAKDWYKPHQNCKMEIITESFCPVCKEGIIERIHDLVSPIDAYTPDDNSLENPTFPLHFQLDLIHPSTNSLKRTWSLNANNIASNTDNIALSETDLTEGSNTLTAVVHDATTALRVNNHETLHVYTVTWTINYSTLGIQDVTSERNDFSISVFPNPSNALVNFKFENTLNSPLKLDIIGMDGKRVQSHKLPQFEDFQIDMSSWSQGIYIAKFYANQVLIGTKKLVKN